jgi:hypothetical protein
MAKNGLDKLSNLMGGASSAPEPQRGFKTQGNDDDDDVDEQLVEDVQAVLDFALTRVKKRGGDGIFDMQTLIESCSEELITQIREEAEGE